MRVDGADALPDRRRAGRAGVLDPRRRLEAQPVVGLQHQARGEILRREAGIEMAEHDLVDLVRPDAGMVERLVRDLDDQRFQRLAFELAEARMRPADDACGHDDLLSLLMCSPKWTCRRLT